MSSKNTKFKQVLLLARTQLELISEKVNLHTVLYFSHPYDVLQATGSDTAWCHLVVGNPKSEGTRDGIRYSIISL